VSILNFRPEIWSANLLVALRKNLVYRSLTNSDYEGEITQAGDTVRITSVGRPTIGTYVPNQTVISPEQVQDSQRTLVVDQSKYFAFQVDDVDQRQARGNVIPQSVNEAAYGFADVIDQYIASLYTGAQTANVIASSGSPVSIATATNPNDAYNKVLVPLRTALTKANVPMAGRLVVVSPDLVGALLEDSRFVKVNESGTEEGLRNGIVGRAAGFDILESNNVPVPTGGVQTIIAGNSTAITFAEQINQIEAYRPQSSFSDAVKGLVLYGAKLVRPDAIATAYVAVS
jgi:N4-gp56 family major capsid protein